MRFVALHAGHIRVAGSSEAETLRAHLTELRQTQVALAGPVLDAGRIADSMEVNLESYRQALDRCFADGEPAPGGLRERTLRACGNQLAEVQHSVHRARLVLERNATIRGVYTEQLQEIRSAQDQREARLQSLQTSLLAAIGSAIGVGQLFLAWPAPKALDSFAQLLLTASVAGVVFLVSHLVFTKDRRNEWADYVIGLIVGALAGGAAVAVLPAAASALANGAAPPMATAASAGGVLAGALAGFLVVKLFNR